MKKSDRRPLAVSAAEIAQDFTLRSQNAPAHGASRPESEHDLLRLGRLLRRPIRLPTFSTKSAQSGSSSRRAPVPASIQFLTVLSLCGRVTFLMVGVPVCMRAPKPEVADISGDSLGARLTRRRRELGLKQKEAAAWLGVGESTLIGWEKSRKLPAATFYPAIISYLGHEPWPVPQTLGERLRAERRRRGLTTGSAAIAIRIDEGTLIRCEHGRKDIMPGSRAKCERFLAGSG